ncbi:MAG: hypothetical protein RL026_1636 [Pseudomonadota bacterium]|jgi:hypothetical protein
MSPAQDIQMDPQATFKKYMDLNFLEEGGVSIQVSQSDLANGPSPALVLTKAVARAADMLDVPRVMLAKVLGVSPPTVTRLYSGHYLLDQRRKEWEFALLFVRLFRSLDSIVGTGPAARQWLASENRALNGRPLDLIRETEGLVRVVHYLDASRGLV